MKQKISDEQLAEALSLFRDSVREFRSTGERKPDRSRIVFAVFAIVMFFLAVVPVYKHRQAESELAAKQASTQDDALLRGVESDVAYSVPQPMQRLELLMVSEAERSR